MVWFWKDGQVAATGGRLDSGWDSLHAHATHDLAFIHVKSAHSTGEPVQTRPFGTIMALTGFVRQGRKEFNVEVWG